MNEQRKAIIISTGMDNLPLLQKLQETPVAVGSMLEKVKGLYAKFSTEKAAIEEKENDASLARLKRNIEQKSAANKAWMEEQTRQYEIARGSIPENMQPGYAGRRGSVGSATGGMIASQVATDIVTGASGHDILKTVEISATGGVAFALGFGISKYLKKLAHRAFGYAVESLGTATSAVPILGTAAAGIALNLYGRAQLKQMTGHYGTDAATATAEEILSRHLVKMISDAVKIKQISPAEGRVMINALGHGMSGIQSVQRDLAKVQLRSDAEIKEAKRVAEFREKVREKFTKFDEESHERYLKRVAEQKKADEEKANRDFQLQKDLHQNKRTISSEINLRLQEDTRGILSLEEAAGGGGFLTGLKNRYSRANKRGVQAMARDYVRQQYGMGYDFEQYSLQTGGDYASWLKTSQGMGEKNLLDRLAGPLKAMGIVKNDDLAGKLDDLNESNTKILAALAKDGILIKSN